MLTFSWQLFATFLIGSNKKIQDQINTLYILWNGAQQKPKITLYKCAWEFNFATIRCWVRVFSKKVKITVPWPAMCRKCTEQEFTNSWVYTHKFLLNLVIFAITFSVLLFLFLSHGSSLSLPSDFAFPIPYNHAIFLL